MTNMTNVCKTKQFVGIESWNWMSILHEVFNTWCRGDVVVQFYPWFKFYFVLFLGMVMYDNEFETKENNI